MKKRTQTLDKMTFNNIFRISAPEWSEILFHFKQDKYPAMRSHATNPPARHNFLPPIIFLANARAVCCCCLFQLLRFINRANIAMIPRISLPFPAATQKWDKLRRCEMCGRSLVEDLNLRSTILKIVKDSISLSPFIAICRMDNLLPHLICIRLKPSKQFHG